MMRINHIKTLVEVDLLQANRQMNDANRAYKLQKRNIYWRVLLQNLAIIVLFIVLFGSMLSNVPLSNFPGIFSQTISFMVLFSVLQLFQFIFNLFYDDANLGTYLALPFTVTELFSSKLITIFLSTFAYFVSPFIYIIILGRQTNHSFILSLFIGLLSSMIIMIVTILTVFIALHVLHQFSFFRKYKKVFTIVLYILLFGFIFYNLYSNESAEVIPGVGIQDEAINLLFVGFHQVFITGQQLDGWLKIGLWIVGGILFTLVLFKWIIPQLYSERNETLTRQRVNRKRSVASLSKQSKWQIFAKYQMRQLQDTTFILQMLFSKFYLPFIMIAPIFFNGGITDLSILNEVSHLWGAYLIIGVALAFAMISESSISGVIISFDKENYYYAQSLPISFREYMKYKFYFAFFH